MSYAGVNQQHVHIPDNLRTLFKKQENILWTMSDSTKVTFLLTTSLKGLVIYVSTWNT